MRDNTRHERITVLVDSSNLRVNFSQVKNLDQKGTSIKSIEIFHAGKRAAIGGVAAITEAAMRDADITLLRGSDEVIQKLPLARLNPADYDGKLFTCSLSDINWETSYIDFYRATNLSSTPQYVILSVTYER
jgi:hypothetical protein